MATTAAGDPRRHPIRLGLALNPRFLYEVQIFRYAEFRDAIAELDTLDEESKARRSRRSRQPDAPPRRADQ